MMAYLIKMILCSGLLLTAYFLLLEKEKMHRFNRFYLLSSLAFSFLVPLIPIAVKSTVAQLPAVENYLPLPATTFIAFGTGAVDSSAPSKIDIFPLILFAFYSIVTFCLLIRYFYTVYTLSRKAKTNKSRSCKNARLVFLKESTATHTFLNTIFISETDHRNQTVEKEILAHELAHVQQKHTLDILLVELLQCFLWFNIFLILYKRAIRLNHEFLADDAVISLYPNVVSYQYLLLDKISQRNSSHLSSSLNFLIAKKRLAMMNVTKNSTRARYKQVALLPLLATAILFFSTKVYSQAQPDSAKKKPTSAEQLKKEPSANKTVIISGPDGVSQELFDEYEAAVKSAHSKLVAKNGQAYTGINASKLDLPRLRAIYDAMSKEQRVRSTKLIGLIPTPTRPPKKSPTQQQLDSWMDAGTYGVWLDGKKISNSKLADYKPADIVYSDISKLYGAAKRNVSYFYQVDLMTPAYYEEVFKDWKK